VGWRSLGSTPDARFLENWMTFDEINDGIECLRTTAVLPLKFISIEPGLLTVTPIFKIIYDL
jgi:hypothetical protein